MTVLHQQFFSEVVPAHSKLTLQIKHFLLRLFKNDTQVEFTELNDL